MLSLSLPTEPHWLDLPLGVRVRVRPLTAARLEAARHRALRLYAARVKAAEAAAEHGMPTDTFGFTDANPGALQGLALQELARALAEYGVVGWEGIGDAAGEPLPINPASIEAFASHPVVGPAFREAYLAPLNAVSAEGNASAPPSAGVSAAAQDTAMSAQDEAPSLTGSTAAAAALA